MQIVNILSQSKVIRVIGLALVLATVVSFQKRVSADAGTGDRLLIVRAFNGDPIADKRISGVTISVNGGPDDGLTGVTDGSGSFTFHVHEGQFAITASHPDFYSADMPIFMDIGQLTADFSLVPKAEAPASSTTTTTTNTTTSTTECSPTPPSGRPMLNIWPIANNGSDCTDYSLLAAENVTASSGYKTGTVNANPGDTIRVRLYVHNGTLDHPENEAINVMVRAIINGNSISAEAWANNADRINSLQKGGDVAIAGATSLSFVDGSAILYDRGPTNARPFSNAVVSATGASLGNMRGCFPFLHFVTFELKANGGTQNPPPPPPPVVVTQVAGIISVAKNVRDLTQGQTIFTNSIAANPGDLLEFQMPVTASNGTVNNVVLSDTLPSRLNFIANTFTVDGNANGNNLTNVSLGNFSSGQTKTVALRATVADASQFSSGNTNLINQALVTSSSNSASAFANVLVSINGTNSNLSITKTVRNISTGQSNFSKSTSANQGDQVQFQIQITANGNSAAQNVVVTDILPSNFNLTSGSTVFNLGTMNVGSTQTVNLSATANNSSCNSINLVNQAQATASNTSSVSDTASVTVSGIGCGGGGGNAVLTLTKEVRNINTNNGFSNFTNATNSDQVQFRLIVRNTGSNTAFNVRVSDFLPNGLNYISGSFQIDSGNNSGNLFNGSAFLGNLFSGQSRTILFNANVNASSSQTLANTATANSDNTNSANAQASVFVSTNGNVNLVLSKRAFNQTQNRDATTSSANPGDIIVYTLSAQNQGSVTASNFVFQDEISDVLDLAILQDFVPASFDLGALTLSWPQVSIAPGSTVEKTFSVKVNPISASSTDTVMRNVYGNTININVNKPTVKGIFIAPKTGSTSTPAIVLATLAMFGYMGFKKLGRRSLRTA